MMLGRQAQGLRQLLVGADPQQALVAGTEVLGGLLRLLQLQMQVGREMTNAITASSGSPQRSSRTWASARAWR